MDGGSREATVTAPGGNAEAGKPSPPEVMSEKGLSPWTQLGVQSAELSHHPSPQGVPESKAAGRSRGRNISAR